MTYLPDFFETYEKTGIYNQSLSFFINNRSENFGLETEKNARSLRKWIEDKMYESRKPVDRKQTTNSFYSF